MGHPPIEATRILSARKVDKLRAQLQQHQRAHRYRTVTRFVTWAAAGALAVAAGGIMAGGILPRLLDDQTTPSLPADESRPVPGAHAPTPSPPTPSPPTNSPPNPSDPSHRAVQVGQSSLKKATERHPPSTTSPLPSAAASQATPSPDAVSLSDLAEEEQVMRPSRRN